MITIKKDIINQIFSHAKSELPNEACGYLAGTNGVVTLAYNLTNIDHSPEHFSFDPAEQFKTVKDARNKGLEILANYHSHPSTPARPSVEDIRLAYDPNISYVIISLANSEPGIKSFKIKDGKVDSEDIKIVD
jgi:[CysO sulfur-carrier protein]-S-L-cysteine hydrolase